MNKTVNINLGGIFFHIDEDAYTKLKKYLDAIRRSLSDDPQGKDEILNDIEARIGELLNEKTKDQRQVINQNDIDAVIEVMGKPEDYVGDEEIFDEELKGKKQKTKKNYTKRLFRDTEDKFLGGVSSGLAHYFNIDVTVVRILWLISFFVFGTGFLVYLVLWILLPQANTTAEKLQMEGEPVNISNIEKKIKEEFGDVSDRIKQGYDDVSSHLKKNNYESAVKTGLQEIITVIGSVLKAIINVFGKFVGVLLIIISFAVLVSLLVSGFTAGSIEFLDGDNFMQLPQSFYSSMIPFWLLSILLVLLIGIPFVFLFNLGLKILSKNSNSLSKTSKSALLGVWLIALLGVSFAGVEFGTKFPRNKTTVSTKQELNIQAKDTLIIQMLPKDNLSYSKHFGTKIVLENGEEKIYDTRIDVNVKRVPMGEVPHIKIFKHATGRKLLDAKNKAEAILYNFEIKNNLLSLNDYFITAIEDKFHNQHVDIIVYVPNGTTVYFDESTKKYLDDVENIQDVYDRNMINHYFKMSALGFDCTSCLDNTNEENSNDNDGSFKMKINGDGLDVKVKSSHKDSTSITIDKNGLEIK
jgi:phage shock protein PspC (stress-responsive transcriptional regulator)